MPRRRREWLHLSLVLALVVDPFHAQRARAEATVVVAPDAPVSPAPPALDGGNAVAVADENGDLTNSAQATAGDGGSVLSPGAGGQGGQADARAITRAPLGTTASSVAEGGAGGSGNQAQGGAGGDALSDAEVTDSAAQIVFAEGLSFGGDAGASFGFPIGSAPNGGAATTFVRARGTGARVDAYGRATGGVSEGAGADATVEIEAVGAGPQTAVRIPPPTHEAQGAFGGQGGFGQPGGAASSMSRGTALGNGNVTVHDHAIAGSTGDTEPSAPPPVGARASSSASASSAGSGVVVVSAEAQGGRGPLLGPSIGGSAAATAHGSSGSGSVNVSTRQLGGAGEIGGDSSATDAVSGSTSGALILSQTAIGGGGRTSAGAASSHLEGSNPGGGPITVRSTAEGGNGPAGGGGSALASATGRGMGDAPVTVEALAQGGFGDGGASLGAVRGISEGAGPVRVTGEARSAIVGSGDSLPQIQIVNAVSGQTAGSLTLVQRALSTGSAESRLDFEGAFALLEIETFAASMVPGNLVTPLPSRSAVASVGGRNSNGPIRAVARVEAQESATATASVSGRTVGDLHDVTVGEVTEFIPRFGVFSMFGDSTSRSEGVAEGNSTVNVFDFARGGNASSSASGVNAGASPVSVSARAIGGDGHDEDIHGEGPGLGGLAEASAAGASTGGADVTVRAQQIAGRGGSANFRDQPLPGRDTSMRDAVSGSTAGALTLEQAGTGGRGGDSLVNAIDGAGGGRAVSELEATNPGGGSIKATARATGGDGGGGRLIFPPTEGSVGGEGGSARASVSAQGEGATSVEAVADATGGNGGFGGTRGGGGGIAELGVVAGHSDTGRVHVTAKLTGGSGGGGSTVAPGGEGAEAILVDQVDGSTHGELILEQIAIGGNSGAGATGLDGADATSRLTRSGSSQSITLRSEARGGGPGSRPGDPAGSGGAATSAADVGNDAGEAQALVLAVGGPGSFGLGGFTGAGSGGAASATARATTTGDGHAVLVGDASSESTGARGGSSSDFDASSSRVGGDATSVSEGVAADDSEVKVFDRAIGGNSATGGDGGRASSTARGSNAGVSAVIVEALARGGEPSPGHSGGDARADAEAESSGGGDVSVSATQIAGGSEFSGTGAPSAMVDRVRGSTRGKLTLEQIAIAGRSGSGGGPGGLASSMLDAINPGGGELAVLIRAEGGQGGSSDGGTATAGGGATSEGAPLSLVVESIGGAAGTGSTSAPLGGVASLGPVFATSSMGGDVSVLGRIVGGGGGRAAIGVPGAAGTDARLLNAVQATTTGVLTLAQEAIGGPGGRGQGSGSNPLGQLAGDGGEAISELSFTTGDASDLRIHSLARGGAGGFGSGQVRGADGGDAITVVEAGSTAGETSASGVAEGGEAGPGSQTTGGNGGAATLRTVARAEAAGAHATAGHDAAASHGATGGDGARGTSGGDGGAAVSLSEAIATDGAASAFDFATGGTGGESASFRLPQPPGDGALGQSEAIARSAPKWNSAASSRALGGNTGSAKAFTPGEEFRLSAGPLPIASAVAGIAISHATSIGGVTARAEAVAAGGLGERLDGAVLRDTGPVRLLDLPISAAGMAMAEAVASGAEAHARAESSTDAANGGRIRAGVDQVGAGEQVSRSLTMLGALPLEQPGAGAFASGGLRPDPQAIPLGPTLLDLGAGGVIHVDASVGTDVHGSEGLSFEFNAEFAFEFFGSGVDGDTALALGFVDTEFGNQLERFEIGVFEDETLLWSLSLEGTELETAAFDDTAVVLREIAPAEFTPPSTPFYVTPSSVDLRLRIAAEGSGDWNVDFVVMEAAPEPAPWVLLLLSVLVGMLGRAGLRRRQWGSR